MQVYKTTPDPEKKTQILGNMLHATPAAADEVLTAQRDHFTASKRVIYNFPRSLAAA